MMTTNFKVLNCPIWEGDNCIMVENFPDMDEVYNIPIKYDAVENERIPESVGLWKIKTLKKS